MSRRLTAALVVGIALLEGCGRPSGEGESPPAAEAPRAGGDRAGPALVLFPLPAVPEDLAPLRATIARLRAEKRFVELAERTRELVDSLERAWGERSPRLPGYWYDRALALKLAGRPETALEETGAALEHWPASLRLRLLDATLRLALSRLRAGLVERTEEAVRVLLEPGAEPGLAALGVRGDDLRLQWAGVLYGLGRSARALEVLGPADDASGESAGARRLRARLLIELRRAREAIPLLERARRDAGGSLEPEPALLLGMARLETGEPEAAIEVLQGAVSRARSHPGGGGRELLGALRVHLSDALRRAGRPKPARQVALAALLSGRADDDVALTRLADALGDLGRADARRAILSRLAELPDHRYHWYEYRRASRRGQRAIAAFHLARAWLSIDRSGDALGVLQGAIAARPRALTLHLLAIETLLSLGRLRRAGRAVAAAERATRSPLLPAVRARLLLRAGEGKRARREIASIDLAAIRELSTRRRARAYRARAFLEAGDDAALEAFARKATEEPARDPASLEIALLARTFLSLRRAEPEPARARLRQEITALEGGEVLARALSLLLALARGDAEPGPSLDPSDLLDEPWLLVRAPKLSLLADRPEARRWLEGALELARERSRLLESIVGRDDRDVFEQWSRLIERLVAGGARRKAREAAWYLHAQNPGGGEEARQLLRVLTRPEDVVVRLALSSRALAENGADSELARQRERALRQLGIEP